MNKKSENKISILELATIYLKTGSMAFGGWPTTSLILERELLEKRSLISKKQLHSATASGQILPGAAQVILAAQVAYFVRGTRGAIIATIAYLMPSVFITFIFSFVYFAYFRGNDFSKYTIGLQAAVAGIVLGNAYRIGKRHITNSYLWILVLLASIAQLILKIPVIIILLVAAVFGLFLAPIINTKFHD